MVSHDRVLRFRLFPGIHIRDEDCPRERDANGDLLPMFLDNHSPAWKSLQASDKLTLHNSQTYQLRATSPFRNLNNYQTASLPNLMQGNKVGLHVLV
jgi:hypothetical protein